jgi:hypothetical protein
LTDDHDHADRLAARTRRYVSIVARAAPGALTGAVAGVVRPGAAGTTRPARVIASRAASRPTSRVASRTATVIVRLGRLGGVIR